MAITKKQAAADKQLLSVIVEATVNGSFTHASEKSLKNLVDSGDVEVNNDIKDAEGNPAVRATQQGIDKMNQETVQTVEPHEQALVESHAPTKPAFLLSSDIPMPEQSRRVTGRTGIYPFDTMEVGQSFFVSDVDKPIKSEDGTVVYDAFKGLSSTISSANLRYSEPTGEKAIAQTGRNAGKEIDVMRPLRKFEQRRLTENGVPGTRVWRVL